MANALQTTPLLDWPVLLCRVTGAAILLYASISKLVESDREGLSNLGWRGMLIVAELVLGFWLLIGLRPRRAIATAFFVYTSFAIYTAVRWAQGDSSPCGCFGRRSVSPAAGLTLDAAAALAFLSMIPEVRRRLFNPASHFFVAVFIAVSVLVLYSGTASSSGPLHPTEASHSTWGLACYGALSTSDSSLASGDWRIVIIQHDCDKCRKFLDLLHSVQSRSDNLHLCIAEIRPFASELERAFLFPTSERCAKLDGASPPCLPAEIIVRSGIVQYAHCVPNL